MTRAEFAEAAYTYCQMTGASETSGTRTRKHNRDKSGVAHSAHLVGLARDVTYDETPSVNERHAWAERLGLVVIVEDDHDHLQPSGWRPG